MSVLTVDALRDAMRLVKEAKERAEKEQLVVVNIDDLLGVLRMLRKVGFKIRRARAAGVKLSIFLISTGGKDMQLLVDKFRYTPRGTYLIIPIEKLNPFKIEFQ